MPELPGHDRREERRARRRGRREVRDGDTYTRDEEERGEVELQEVPRRPEPPVEVSRALGVELRTPAGRRDGPARTTAGMSQGHSMAAGIGRERRTADESHSRMDAYRKLLRRPPRTPPVSHHGGTPARMARMTAPNTSRETSELVPRYVSTITVGRYGRELREPTAHGLSVTSIPSRYRPSPSGTPSWSRTTWLPIAMPLTTQRSRLYRGGACSRHPDYPAIRFAGPGRIGRSYLP